MGLETGLLIGSALLGAGGTAYSARQQKKAGQDATAAAEKAAKLSQSQEGQGPVDQMRRNQKRKTGFDPVSALMPGGTGDLLGS